MKKPAFFPEILTAAICMLACNQPHKAAPFVTSDDYKKGLSFYETNNDSAFYYFNKTATSSHDSLQISTAYTYMAMIQSDAGDYFGSQESLLQSMKHLDEQKESYYPYLLSDFNELGSVSLSLKNYDSAVAYYDKALKFTKDESTKIIALSNKAVAYQKMRKYAQAISIYDSILDKTKADIKRYARILSNSAFTKWLQDPAYPAAPALLTALQIQKNEKDNWRLNASYAHLSDYYFHSQPDSALFYANNMYAVAHQLNSPDDELEALQKIIALGKPDSVKKYFTLYRVLNDSIQTSRNNAKNQFALIRYDVAKSKADNLSLQKENAEKKIEILLQWAMLIGLITAGIIIFLWYRKRRERMLREQQLKTSQKVHDVVANGLYHIMAKIQYEDNPDKESLLDDIETLYEQSRNISYEQTEEIPASYSDSISNLLTTFSSSTIKLSIIGNTEEIWNSIKPNVKNEIRYILQELMINMKKHSAANNVVIRFGQQAGKLNIMYTDDGKGLPEGFKYNNGLKNTETRIATIRGNINFDTATPKGLKIQLSIPIT